MPIVGSSTARTMQDVVDAVKQRLQGSHTGARLDILNGTISETDTDVVLTDDVTGIKAGTVIEVELEQMYVRSVDEGTKTLTVMRGHNSTVAASHATGKIVRIAPSYYLRDIFLAVQDEFTALNGTGLVHYQQVEITHDGNVQTYDSGLPTGVQHLWVQRAEYEANSTYEKWRPIRVELVKDVDTSDYASGSAFKVLDSPRKLRGGSVTASTTIRLNVATTFGRPTSLSDTISEGALGTSESVVPIVAVGAAWRLILGKEAQRLNPDWSHGSRRAEEVQPGSIAFLGRALESQREELIQHALEQQMSKYPPRMER